MELILCKSWSYYVDIHPDTAAVALLVCWLLFLFIAGTSMELLRLNVANEGGPDTIKTNGQKETYGVPLY